MIPPDFRVRERCHVVPVSSPFRSTILSPSIDLASCTSGLRPLVSTLLHRIVRRFVAVERTKLCSESQLAVSLFAGEADVGNLLLRPREPATGSEVLLFDQTDGSEIHGTGRAELLFDEIKTSACRRANSQGGAEHRAVRLRVRFA